MTDHERTWVVATSYRHGYEADIAVAKLEASGIIAVKRGDSFVGLVSPGYDRHFSGVQVLVPSNVVEEARRIMNESPASD